MTTTLRRADRIPPVGHAEAMRLTEAENARLLAQLQLGVIPAPAT
jgi:hypothetical protein